MSNNQLTALVERIERVESDIRDRQEDRKQIYIESKSAGFDPKIIRKLVSIRRKKEQAIQEESELLRSYAEQLGMQLDLAL